MIEIYYKELIKVITEADKFPNLLSANRSLRGAFAIDLGQRQQSSKAEVDAFIVSMTKQEACKGVSLIQSFCSI